MFHTRAKTVASALAVTLLVWLAAAFGTHLSDQAVREAYFLGQRSDEKTAEFLESYLRRLPMPQSGLYVSEIELFTPYAEVVDLSRQHTVGYSAQQAAQEYRDRGDVFRLRVRVFFTDTYSLSCPLSKLNPRRMDGPVPAVRRRLEWLFCCIGLRWTATDSSMQKNHGIRSTAAVI